MQSVVDQPPVLLLTTEAARILEVSPETVRLWERNGRLPALKTSRGVRLFKRSDIERLRDARSVAHDAGLAPERGRGAAPDRCASPSKQLRKGRW